MSNSYGFENNLKVSQISASADRFTLNFPFITYFKTNSNFSYFIYRPDPKTNYGFVNVFYPSDYKKISPGIPLFILYNNNALSIQSSISSAQRPISILNVADFCYSSRLNLLTTLFVNNTVSIFYISSYTLSYDKLYDFSSNTSQISCGDEFYFLLHQNGTLYGGGSTNCGRLGILIPGVKNILNPIPISNTLVFSNIKNIYNITMAQVKFTNQWLYWGENYPLFFEPHSREFCFYMDPIGNSLTSEKAEYYMKNSDFLYYKTVYSDRVEEVACIEREMNQMNTSSVLFMGNSLLVTTSDGTVYSNDPNFTFLENLWVTSVFFAITAYGVCCIAIICIVMQVLIVIWCVRCGRRRKCNQVDGLKTVFALIQVPVQIAMIFNFPINVALFSFSMKQNIYLFIAPTAVFQLLIGVGVDLIVFSSCICDLCSLRKNTKKNSTLLPCKLFIQFCMSIIMWIIFLPYEFLLVLLIQDDYNTRTMVIVIGSLLPLIRIILTIAWVESNAYWPLCLRSAAHRIKTSQERKLAKIEMDLTQRLLGYEEGKPKIKLNRQLFEIPYQELEDLSQIGAGGSGSIVFKGKWKGKSVALKLFNTTDETVIQDFENEAEVMMSVRHPNIVTIFGVVIVDRIGLVLQYCSKGSLFKVLQNENQPLQPSTKLKWLRQVAAGIKYLHDRNILHRDIKSENILIDEFDNALIADFGTSKFCTENSTRNTFSAKGTAAYIAPEVVREMPYGFKADVFSFSIVMYEIVMNTNKPYGHDTKYGIEFKVEKDPNFRPILPNNFENNFLFVLMKQCWEDDAEKRPDFDTICNMLDQMEEHAF